MGIFGDIFRDVAGAVIGEASNIVGIFSAREERKALEASAKIQGRQADRLSEQLALIRGLDPPTDRRGVGSTGTFGAGFLPGSDPLSLASTFGFDPGAVSLPGRGPATRAGFFDAGRELLGIPPGGFFGGGGGDMAIPTAPQRLLPGGGSRTASELIFVNPKNGQPVFYVNRGRPILFSRDLKTCKTVQKVARMARRASPRAATRHRHVVRSVRRK